MITCKTIIHFLESGKDLRNVIMKPMKKKLILPLLAFSLFLNGLFVFKEFGGTKETREAGDLKGRVVRVIDGDTFDLEGETRVRLAGAEAPEYPEGCLSLKAKERLEELVLGKEVSIENVEKDNFGRQVGFVILNDLLVDKVLVEEGLAQAASGQESRYGAGLLSAQENAQKAERGIWSSLCAPKENCVIKGNYRKDLETKVYHLPDCYNYEKIVVNEQEGDVWFCSEEEAQAAGFRKAEDCP
jgi:micrococcal nuclease